jgi:hypothetical protein
LELLVVLLGEDDLDGRVGAMEVAEGFEDAGV